MPRPSLQPWHAPAAVCSESGRAEALRVCPPMCWALTSRFHPQLSVLMRAPCTCTVTTTKTVSLLHLVDRGRVWVRPPSDTRKMHRVVVACNHLASRRPVHKHARSKCFATRTKTRVRDARPVQMMCFSDTHAVSRTSCARIHLCTTTRLLCALRPQSLLGRAQRSTRRPNPCMSAMSSRSMPCTQTPTSQQLCGTKPSPFLPRANCASRSSWHGVVRCLKLPARIHGLTSTRGTGGGCPN